MNNTRYVYKTVPISEERAKEERASQIQDECDEIEYFKSQIQECEDHITHLKSEPLPTTREEQIILNPGDPGYDEAPALFRPENYQGEFKWINQ